MTDLIVGEIERSLIARYQGIQWFEPAKITIPGPDGEVHVEACRFCIAIRGVKAQDLLKGIGVIPVGGLPAHLTECHSE